MDVAEGLTKDNFDKSWKVASLEMTEMELQDPTIGKMKAEEDAGTAVEIQKARP